VARNGQTKSLLDQYSKHLENHRGTLVRKKQEFIRLSLWGKPWLAREAAGFGGRGHLGDFPEM